MPKFRVVAERNFGIRDGRGKTINPFKIRNLFDPNLRMSKLCRTWDIESDSDESVRKSFAQAQSDGHEDVLGFEIVSIELLDAAPTTEQMRQLFGRKY